MRDISHFLYHLVVCIITLLRPGGVKSVAAENLKTILINLSHFRTQDRDSHAGAPGRRPKLSRILGGIFGGELSFT
jgi:hypothetical protein